MTSTVLVNGATGNIGVAAIIGALRSKQKVLAIVRNQSSANKLFENVGTHDGITTVEADITSETGVQSVVDQVRAGKLPAFQHVYSCAGAWRGDRMHEVDTEYFHQTMNVNLDANFFAYRATVPYLLEQNNPHSTWTQCTGAAPEYGAGGVTAISQGALSAMINVACKDNEKTNIRVNEVYLAARVDYDAVAEKHDTMKASEFAKVYEGILARPEIDASAVVVRGQKDVEELSFHKKLGGSWSGVTSLKM